MDFIFICFSFMIMHKILSHPLDHLPIINDLILCRHYKSSFCQSFRTMEVCITLKENTLMYLGEYFSSAFLGLAEIFQPPLFLSRDRPQHQCLKVHRYDEVLTINISFHQSLYSRYQHIPAYTSATEGFEMAKALHFVL